MICNESICQIVKSKILSEEDITAVKCQIARDKEAHAQYVDNCRTKFNTARMICMVAEMYFQQQYMIFLEEPKPD